MSCRCADDSLAVGANGMTGDHLKPTMPVLVLAAADDISFPGDAVVRRLKSTVPNTDGEVIAGSKHCPPTTPEFRSWVADRITAFMNG